MTRYVYAFRTEECDDEVLFEFPSLPEVISAVPRETYATWDSDAIHSHAEDAVLTTLQSAIVARDVIPPPRDRVPGATGFVTLSAPQAMKLELYIVSLESVGSVAEFARRIGKQDTAARRLLNLRHRSTTQEISDALASLGREFDIQITTTPASAQLEDASARD